MSHPESNQAMVMPSGGAPLELVERPVPEPGPGQVLVRVHASSLNFHDVVNLMGLIAGPWPRVPMGDGAGEVVALGDGVTQFSPGDRVIGGFYPLWLDGEPTRENKRANPGDTGDGWLQQYQVADASALALAPANLTYEEAATLPCAGVAAWRGLVDGGIRPGDTVVTLGTGGLSLFAVQFAAALGATVIATSSSNEKLKVASTLGAHHVINYQTTPDWHTEVKTITDRRGADLVLDVGGPETLKYSMKAVRIGGAVGIMGLLSGFDQPQVAVADIMVRHLRLFGVNVGSVADTHDLARFVEKHDIHPHISHIFGWDEVPQAVELAQAGGHLGKIAITIP